MHAPSVGWLLFVLFIVLPFVDLVLLLRVGGLIGFFPTVLLTFATGGFGAWLAKREGLRVWRAWTRALAELRAPEQGIIDGVLVIAGGALLMAPGVLTDLIGLAFLLPLTRKLIARPLRAWATRRIERAQVRLVETPVMPFDLGGDAMRATGDVVDTTGDVVDTTGESLGEVPELPGPPER